MVSFVLTPIIQSTTEGGILTFSVSIKGANYRSIGEYVIYWRTHGTSSNAASSSDYDAVTSLQKISFSAKSKQTFTFTIDTNADATKEGTEYFSVALYDFQKNYLKAESVFSIKDAPPADLAIGKLSVSSSSVTPGSDFSVTWSVVNVGDGPAARSKTIIYLSRDPYLDGASDIKLSTFSIDALAADATKSGVKTVEIPSGWGPGKAYIIIMTDADGDVREPNEKNNTLSIPIQVGPQPWSAVAAPIIKEMARLAVESYDSTPKFGAWVPLGNYELGQLSGSGLKIDFSSGRYVATTNRSGLPDPEAVALVARGLVNGERTVVIAFQGSSFGDDWFDYFNFGGHYKKFAPLIASIEQYASAHGIDKILVTGHSLGGAMVQHFLALHPNDHTVSGFTFGSPGGNVRGKENDPRLVNFGHTDDLIFHVPKDLEGAEIHINSGRSKVPTITEHAKELYQSNLALLYDFATDKASPFYHSSLAPAMRAGKPYSGPDFYVAVADTPVAGTKHIQIGPRDSWALGSAGSDQFNWRFEPASIAKLVRVDGGPGNDTLILATSAAGQSQWSWRTTSFSGVAGYELSFNGKVVGEVYRLEALVFGTKTVPLGGASRNVVAYESAGDDSGAIDSWTANEGSGYWVELDPGEPSPTILNAQTLLFPDSPSNAPGAFATFPAGGFSPQAGGDGREADTLPQHAVLTGYDPLAQLYLGYDPGAGGFIP